MGVLGWKTRPRFSRNMKCTYFNAFTVPVYSRARKIEIKWAKTAPPPIHVASQYESINVSPPSGLSVNRSPLLSSSSVYPRSPPRRPRWPVSKRSIFEKGLSKCSVTLVCRYIIEKREHSERASIPSRSVWDGKSERGRFDVSFFSNRIF